MAVAAAMYLIGLPAGRYFDPDGHVTDAGEMNLHNLNEGEADRIRATLVTPPITSGWISPDFRPEQQNGAEPKIRHVMIEARKTLREDFLLPDGRKPADIIISTFGTWLGEEVYRVQQWSARCPEVIFIEHDNLKIGQRGDLRAYHAGRCLDCHESERDDGSEQVKKDILRRDGWQTSKPTIKPLPEPFRSVNKGGPDALLAAIDRSSGTVFDTVRALAVPSFHGLSLLDMAITSDWDEFLPPGVVSFDPPPNNEQRVDARISCKGNAEGEIDSRYMPPSTLMPFKAMGFPKGRAESSHYAAIAPRLDLERIQRLSALCSEHAALAQAIGMEFGRTANGCHVSAFMARAAAPGTPQAMGVARVLENATFNIASQFGFWTVQNGPERTAAALIASGNPDAWRFLKRRCDPAMLAGEGARYALQSLRDARTYVEAFGPAEIKTTIKAETSKDTFLVSGAIMSLIEQAEATEDLTSGMLAAINPPKPPVEPQTEETPSAPPADISPVPQVVYYAAADGNEADWFMSNVEQWFFEASRVGSLGMGIYVTSDESVVSEPRLREDAVLLKLTLLPDARIVDLEDTDEKAEWDGMVAAIGGVRARQVRTATHDDFMDTMKEEEIDGAYERKGARMVLYNAAAVDSIEPVLRPLPAKLARKMQPI
jgi:hypothetical protein